MRKFFQWFRKKDLYANVNWDALEVHLDDIAKIKDQPNLQLIKGEVHARPTHVGGIRR